MTLYDDLGVHRDADDKEIRDGYRRAAKKAHPDAGGSSEAFGQVALAHRILSDKEKRAKYDATGQVDDAAQCGDAPVLEMVAQIINALCDRPDAVHIDIFAEAKRILNDGLTTQMRGRANVEADIARVQKMRARITAKQGKTDRVGIMVDARITAMKQALAAAEAHIDAIKRALALVGDQQFEPEPRQMSTFSASSNATSAFAPAFGWGR